MLLPPHNKEIIKMTDLRRIILFIVLIQAVKLEIKPCTNSMWVQSTINNCFPGQMEHVEGHAKLITNDIAKTLCFCELLPVPSQ